jgi:hypothetical protein
VQLVAPAELEKVSMGHRLHTPVEASPGTVSL